MYGFRLASHQTNGGKQLLTDRIEIFKHVLSLAHIIHRNWPTKLDNLAYMIFFGSPTPSWVSESSEEISTLCEFIDLQTVNIPVMLEVVAGQNLQDIPNSKYRRFYSIWHQK